VVRDPKTAQEAEMSQTGIHTTYTSAGDLSQALRRAAAAHGEHEARTGEADANWPDWYAEYMVREQAGQELPL
jgi:hypothetical protein